MEYSRRPPEFAPDVALVAYLKVFYERTGDTVPTLARESPTVTMLMTQPGTKLILVGRSLGPC